MDAKWRKFLLGLGCALGVVGGVALYVPQLAPFAPALTEASKQATAAGNRICDEVTCGCDRKGECGVHGPVALDGGATCLCP